MATAGAYHVAGPAPIRTPHSVLPYRILVDKLPAGSRYRVEEG